MARPRRQLGNLPADSTSFVGRRREMAEIAKKLTSARLVSLVGPGGVGKTRLAIKSGRDLGRRFAHGAWLIELAEVRDPSLVVVAALAALDLRIQTPAEPLAALLSYLREKEALLVLDNCEHLLDAAATLVTEVMRAAPGVRLIATSREPLSALGEHVVPVTPLDLPAPGQTEPLAEMRRHEAVLLFEERAVAAAGEFEVTGTNQSAVAAVCRRLDGLPLAIELAAVRTRVLSVDEILARLTDRFALLGGARAATPRHQTLRTAFEWSHDLLTVEERLLLRRLSVFAGRFMLQDVTGVCVEAATSDEVALALLSSLVEKSLVMRESLQGQACFQLHETMREYAAVKAREAGEDASIKERCIEHYRVRCAVSAAEAPYHLVGWLAWIDLEIDNLRWALRTCIDHDDFERGVDVATGLKYFWVTRAAAEGVRWLDELLSAGSGRATPRARAGYVRGLLAWLQSDPKGGRAAIRDAVAAARQAGPPSLLIESLSVASTLEDMTCDHSLAAGLLAEAQDASTGLDDYPASLTLLRARAFHGLAIGDLDAARAAATVGERMSRGAGDLYGLEMMLMNIGAVALIAGDLDEAKRRFTESLGIAGQIDDRAAQYYLLGGLARCVAGSGQMRLAAQLLGAAESMGKAIGAGEGGGADPRVTEALEAPIAALGSSKYEAAFESGRGLRRGEALRLALGAAPRSCADNRIWPEPATQRARPPSR
ncbi:MAG: hypothetical protein JOZ73_01570 [Solirubrobacterales bacterium]|nr:hypothetical protein [Solirubrobacterales bacterium]